MIRTARPVTWLAAAVLLAWSLPAHAQTLHFTSTMSGANEVPPILTPGSGTATWCYDTVTKTIDFDVIAVGLMGVPTAAHIHDGPAGFGGPVVFNLGPATPTGPTSATYSGTTPPLTPAEEAKLLAGALYVNVHSTAFGSGEVRDQLVPTPVASTQAPRTSALPPFNPPVLLPSGAPGPIIDAVWSPTLDPGAYAPPLSGVAVQFLAISVFGAATPELPIGSDGTWILCSIAPPDPFLVLGPFPPTVVAPAVPIPGLCGLVGAKMCAQGFAVDPGSPLFIRMGNAIDFGIGSL